MNVTLTLMVLFVAWLAVRRHYQHTRIALLGSHLANLQLERHMETLTQGYTRAIQEKEEMRQTQVLELFAPTERSAAAQARLLAEAMQKESTEATRLGIFTICVPYIERFMPSVTRDFRKLLHIHAAGLRHVVDNEENWDIKTRAFHLSAELYLLQHSCHWFCKSRGVADARLALRHQVQHQKVLESVSPLTRKAYLSWQQDGNNASPRT